MILGLDISTSITGITILNNDGSVEYCGYCDTKKEKDFFKKVDMLEEEIRDVTSDKDITAVYVEESLQKFQGGKSSAAILNMLTKYNGIIQWIVRDIFELDPICIAAGTARKSIGITIRRNGLKAKEQVMEHMLTNEDWFEVEFKKTGRIKDHCYDMMDSFVIAKSGWLQCQK